MGKVFDLTTLHRLPRGAAAGSWNNPLMVYFSPPDSLEPRYDRGIITPELYRIDGTWWILCSAGRQQVCLLKSRSGGPEGPYDLVGPKAIHNSVAGILDSGFVDTRTDAYMFAYDPSFYIEGDAVYLVFGPGWIARMHDDLGRGLAEKPRLLEIEGGLYAGTGGCRIRRQNGQYHLTAVNAWGDTVEYTSGKLHGPYLHPRLILPQSGRPGLFRDASGQMRAVVK